MRPSPAHLDPFSQ